MSRLDQYASPTRFGALVGRWPANAVKQGDNMPVNRCAKGGRKVGTVVGLGAVVREGSQATYPRFREVA
jgi:hypothetical protein